MQRSDFYFSLPKQLIACHPLKERDSSRLLYLDADTGAVKKSTFNRLPDFLRAGDLLVMNDTAVIPAQLTAQKPTGGKVGITLERQIDEKTIKAQLRASKTPKIGAVLQIDNDVTLRITGRDNEMFTLNLVSPKGTINTLLEQYGQVPLPPYMRRIAAAEDKQRYQTVYARHPGSVAAPTAGLHFTDALLKTLQKQGIDCVFLTLHIGAGTFQPVRVDDIYQHKMHRERVHIDHQAVAKIKQTKKRGGRIVAVGTTVVRSLEAASATGTFAPFSGETAIFIYPGFEFKVVDMLITNFHLPESTLLMLVCALSGKQHLFDAYRYAIAHRFRFYSYGDAMLISKKK